MAASAARLRYITMVMVILLVCVISFSNSAVMAQGIGGPADSDFVSNPF